jgi:hypothetical protein
MVCCCWFACESAVSAFCSACPAVDCAWPDCCCHCWISASRVCTCCLSSWICCCCASMARCISSRRCATVAAELGCRDFVRFVVAGVVAVCWPCAAYTKTGSPSSAKAVNSFIFSPGDVKMHSFMEPLGGQPNHTNTPGKAANAICNLLTSDEFLLNIGLIGTDPQLSTVSYPWRFSKGWGF